ncbi:MULTISPECIES: DUF2934 domain-containing protein [unclassified Aureimonas]|uniref:DUF2934 domain-containing protein n=1 Tax=unclassified Aureimonas TaxID=2615206 RepID=UPI0006FB3131|nr:MULTISPECIES: DUF2934 domain-containing protein [unclassified Aureimonas]KQT53917.1 hypothetical protein ASG62_11835 [Aureimonas sp. Leaf427]KQT71643.1 hypothetical protein ASG54_19325 [Aureimonas sp. Leaf460]
MDDDERIRRKAHELWEHEGRPEGRSATHWASAREIVALEDSFGSTLKPVEETLEEVAEPEFMAENQGDVPGLTDVGEDSGGPSRDREKSVADQLPLAVDKKKPARKGKSKG